MVDEAPNDLVDGASTVGDGRKDDHEITCGGVQPGPDARQRQMMGSPYFFSVVRCVSYVYGILDG